VAPGMRDVRGEGRRWDMHYAACKCMQFAA
jgi:hypothetical protein